MSGPSSTRLPPVDKPGAPQTIDLVPLLACVCSRGEVITRLDIRLAPPGRLGEDGFLALVCPRGDRLTDRREVSERWPEPDRRRQPAGGTGAPRP